MPVESEKDDSMSNAVRFFLQPGHAFAAFNEAAIPWPFSTMIALCDTEVFATLK